VSSLLGVKCHQPNARRRRRSQRGPVGDPNHDHGACFFSDKVRNGEAAGYDVVIVANHHAGAQGGETPGA
jgi:hypothetical protein